MDNSIVHKLIIENKKCVGVKVGNSNRLRKSQKSTNIFANGEVVLSAGAFISPALLQLSGIGHPDDLKQAGVDLIHELPSVGQNLRYS